MSKILPGDPAEIPSSWLLDAWDRIATDEGWRAFMEARKAGKSVLDAEALGQQARDQCWSAMRDGRKQAIEQDTRLKETGA